MNNQFNSRSCSISIVQNISYMLASSGLRATCWNRVNGESSKTLLANIDRHKISI